MVSFAAIRTLARNGLAIASLQAIDGRGDAAVDTMLPIMQVGYKLQPSSRTLVRAMVGVIVERMSLEVAGFILDSSSVSPVARERLASALHDRDAKAGARHIAGVEYALMFARVGEKPLGDICAAMGNARSQPSRKWAMNLLSPFIYNPRATINLYGDLSADWQEEAARREVVEMEARGNRFFRENYRLGFKNLVGTTFLCLSIPAEQKVIENYWKTQDLRTALLSRLK